MKVDVLIVDIITAFVKIDHRGVDHIRIDLMCIHLFRVRLNFLSYSLRRLRPRRHMLLSRKLWAPSRWSCKAYKLYCSAGLYLPGKSIFARPKMIAPTWPKVVRPVADHNDVARCGLSIGLFLAPLFHD